MANNRIPANDRLRAGRRSTYNIPFKTGSPGYQRALRICHKTGMKYSAPIDYESIGDNSVVRVPNKQEVSQPHWKEIIRQTVSPTHTPRLIAEVPFMESEGYGVFRRVK